MRWTTGLIKVCGGAFLAASLFGQQAVTTTGGTVNVVPKYSGAASIVPSAIVETGGHVGIGTTAPLYPLNVVNTVTGTSGAFTNTFLQSAVNPAAASSATYIGLQGQSYTRLGNAQNFTGNLFGALYQVDHFGNGGLSAAYGFEGKVSNHGTGVLANAYGLWLQIQNTGTGAISNSYALRIGAPINNGGGAISNSYGIYIENPTVGANRYSIYSAGGTNYFAGALGVGTASPSSPLTVAGVIQSTSGGFKFPDGSTQTTATLRGPAGPQGPPGSSLSLPYAASVSDGGTGNFAFSITNTGQYGGAIQAIGGDLGPGFGATGGSGAAGAVFTGGLDNMHIGPGPGISAVGGASAQYFGGGDGGVFYGGPSPTYQPAGSGIYAKGGQNPDGTYAFAAYLDGDVTVSGSLSKAGGSFKIDDPLDPANKYLYHSFVESPDMKNIYDGNVTTDATGTAVVKMPEWFSALNRDFRYQLTVIGQFAQAIVASELANNEFTIRTDKPMVKVSWQVTGIRHDAWADAHRIPVEVDKSAQERGHYMHPDLFGEPETKSVLAVHRPGIALQKERERASAQSRAKQ